MQALAGALFGYIAVKRGLSSKAVRRVALKTAGNTLTWGGLAFIIAGIFGEIFPRIASSAINTGIHIHNLDNLVKLAKEFFVIFNYPPLISLNLKSELV